MTRRIRRPRRGPMACAWSRGQDRTPSEWPCVGSVEPADDWHRAAGLWAVDTLNPNAWVTGLEYLRNSTADLALVQETKVTSGDCAAQEAAARTAKWSASIVPANRGPAGGPSAGVAVCARGHIGLSLPVAAAQTPACAAGRFGVRRAGAVCRGGIHLAAVYLHTSVGAAAQQNLDLLEEVAATLRALCGPWVLGGDFNATPAELASTGFLRLLGGAVIKAPGVHTNGVREIDLFRCLPLPRPRCCRGPPGGA